MLMSAMPFPVELELLFKTWKKFQAICYFM